jgi:hypothetical protein
MTEDLTDIAQANAPAGMCAARALVTCRGLSSYMKENGLDADNLEWVGPDFGRTSLVATHKGEYVASCWFYA